MKITFTLLFIFCIALGSFGATNELSSALQKGLFEEEANRDLDAAAKAYQSAIAQFDKDRKLGATAIFRLGEVYRKQGKTNEAGVQYTRIVREFSDQTDLVKLSRPFVSGSNTDVDPTTVAQDYMQLLKDRPTAQAEYEKYNWLSKLDGFSAEDLKTVLPSVLPVPDENLNSLLRELALAEQKAAQSRQDLGKDHPDMRKLSTMVDVIGKQVDLRISGILKGYELKRSAAESRLNEITDEIRKITKATTPASDQLHQSSAGATSEETEEIKRIQALIKNSPDLIDANKTGLNEDVGTPLHQAAENGRLEVAKFLLASGANVNARTAKKRSTPLRLAALNGHRAMVELLLQNHAETAVASAETTPLHGAVENGFRSVAEILIKHKAPVNASDSSGATPLHIAASRGDEAMAQFLLAHGADVNAKTKSERTPLFSAGSDVKMIQLLIKHGVDVNTQDAESNSPLLSAVDRTWLEAAKTLVENKANVNASNVAGQTPLFVAISKPDIQMAELLLKNGAKVDVENRKRETIWRATFNRFLGFRDDSTRAQFAKLVELLLTHGADANDKTDGESLLHSAVWNGHSKITGLLITHGANVNTTNQAGATPLHYAAQNRDKEITELLLKNGADPNRADNQGQPPIDRAKPKPGSSYASTTASPEETIALLKKYGAREDLQRRLFISVERLSSKFSEVVFSKDKMGLNRHTLFEFFALIYAGEFGNTHTPGHSLKFPNLERMKIRRLAANGKETETPVNFHELLASGDCSKDIWLEWGDVVEIPEIDHRLNERWSGFPGENVGTIQKCLERQATVTVQGESKTVTLGEATSGRFWPSVAAAVFRSDLLRASSDQNRLRLLRFDPVTKKEMEFMLDRSVQGHIWLRDGDKIEVPERDPNDPPVETNSPLRSIPTTTLRLPPQAPQPVQPVPTP